MIYMTSTSSNPELLKNGTPMWGISILKRQREVIAVAYEGTGKATGPDSIGFVFMPFSCRKVEVRSGANRMTEKVKAHLVEVIKRKLKDEGLAVATASPQAA